jgi:hypothetical protein
MLLVELLRPYLSHATRREERQDRYLPPAKTLVVLSSDNARLAQSSSTTVMIYYNYLQH